MLDLHILLCDMSWHYHISESCWTQTLSVSFHSPFSIISYYYSYYISLPSIIFSFSRNLCFTAVVCRSISLDVGLWALSLLYYCRA